MSFKFSKTLLNLLRAAVTIGAVGWLLLKIDWRDQMGENGYQAGLLTLFKGIRPQFLFVGLVTFPLVILLGAIRWRQLMRAHDMDPGLRDAVRITWLGYFWNLVLPGLTGGDVVKAYYVARAAEKRSISVLTVLLDRVIGLCGLAALSGVVILFNLHNSELREVRSWILIFILVMIGVGVLFFSRRLRRWLAVNWLIGVLPFQERVSQLDDALFAYRYHKKTLLGALGLSIVAHAINVGMFFLAGKSLGLPVPWYHYYVFIPVTLMIAALPFSVGGIGVLEGGVAHFLTVSAPGVNVAGAFAICVVYRIMTILIALPGALFKLNAQAVWEVQGNRSAMLINK